MHKGQCGLCCAGWILRWMPPHGLPRVISLFGKDLADQRSEGRDAVLAISDCFWVVRQKGQQRSFGGSLTILCGPHDNLETGCHYPTEDDPNL